MNTDTTLPKETITQFVRKHQLPDSYIRMVDDYLLVLVGWLATQLNGSNTKILGINGAQGTGKSTLAAFLELATATTLGKSVAVLSIDDFYLTKTERWELAQSVHSLLATRGVPGTHDLPMLKDCLLSLQCLEHGEQTALPRFDKAKDDRLDRSSWPIVSGPVDLIILEGWCVGSTPQDEVALEEPINELERCHDPSGDWRRFVNKQLAQDYATLFSALDMLVFLKAPSFDAVYRWRLEQEQKLAASKPLDVSGVMNEQQLASFIQHFERITRHNLGVVEDIADVCLRLGANHDCVAANYRN